MAHALLRITEWAYQGPGAGPGTAGSFALSGVPAPGASAIICELPEADFRALWILPASVLVFGGCTQNLSRSDECNIYDGTTLIDRLTNNDRV